MPFYLTNLMEGKIMILVKENILRKKLNNIQIKLANEIFKEIMNDILLVLYQGNLYIWTRVPFINIKELKLIRDAVNNNYFEYIYVQNDQFKISVYVNSRTLFLYYMQKIVIGGSEIFVTTSQKEFKISKLEKETNLDFQEINFIDFEDFLNLSLPLNIKLNNTYTFGKHVHAALTYKDAFLALDDIQKTSNDVNKRKKCHEVSIQILLSMVEEMEQNIPGDIDDDLY